MSKLLNTLTYSGSRIGKYNQCPYGYYLYYYKSWGGWECSPEHDRWKLWKLKRLYSKPAWVGVFIHNWLKQYIKMYYRHDKHMKKIGIPFQEAWANDLEEWWAVSKAGCFTSDKTPVLPEHHNEIEAIGYEDLYEEIFTKFANFLDVIPKRVLKFIECEDILDLDPEGFPYYIVDGVKIISVIDFSYMKKDKKIIYIRDWKTGAWTTTGQTSEQLLSYVHYYRHKYSDYRLTAENFNVAEFNLDHKRFTHTKVTIENVAGIDKTIRKNIKFLRSLLVDVDNNIPMPEENFEVTADKSTCVFCPFSSVCKYNCI